MVDLLDYCIVSSSGVSPFSLGDLDFRAGLKTRYIPWQ